MDRCPWATGELLAAYHDEEWGVPVRGDAPLFEMLSLEGAQAGLSWLTVLQKRNRYREVFEGFEPARVARLSPAAVDVIVRDTGVIRHRGKIESVVSNARCLLRLLDECGSLAGYIDGVIGTPSGRWKHLEDLPAETAESRELSRNLKRRGFRFVGPTTCYSFLQAGGFVNGHLVGCPRHDQIASLMRSAQSDASPRRTKQE